MFTAASEVIVYGDNPGSTPARAMVKRLIQAKVRNVWLFSGGLQEWETTGGTVERDAEPSGPK